MVTPGFVRRSIFTGWVLAVLAACEPGSGPTVSLDVPLTGETLQATTTDSRLCCCRVTGTAENRSVVPVHVTLKYEAYRQGQQDPVGTAVAFLSSVQPGERRRFVATGFVVSCASIDRFTRVDTNVRGVYFPEGAE